MKYIPLQRGDIWTSEKTLQRSNSFKTAGDMKASALSLSSGHLDVFDQAATKSTNK
jgi:hypothetical protein